MEVLAEHRSSTSGYDGVSHFWRCACGWECGRAVSPFAPVRLHEDAIDWTWRMLTAHIADPNNIPRGLSEHVWHGAPGRVRRWWRRRRGTYPAPLEGCNCVCCTEARSLSSTARSR